MTTQTKPTQPKLTIITPPALAAYAFVWQARPSLSPGGEPQFSITLLFDKKKADLTEMRRIAMNAAKKKFGDKLPKPLLSPFHDGDEEKPDDTLYAGKIYVNAKPYEARHRGSYDATDHERVRILFGLHVSRVVVCVRVRHCRQQGRQLPAQQSPEARRRRADQRTQAGGRRLRRSRARRI